MSPKTYCALDHRLDELLKMVREMDPVEDDLSSADTLDELLLRIRRLREESDPRLTSLLKVLKEYAEMNFNAQATYSGKGDEIDALAVGINMMGERLRESSISRQYFDDILRNLVGMVFVVDLMGNVTMVNKEVESKLGYTQDQMLGQPLANFISDMDEEWMAEDGHQREIPANCIKSGGGKIPIIFSASSLPTNSNNLPSFVCLAYDISHSKAVEAKLRESEYIYRNILETMKEGVLMVGLDKKIFFTNQRFSELTGYNQDELLGQNPSDLLLLEEDHQFMTRMFHNRLEAKSDIYEIQIRTKSGETKWIMISASPIHDIHGEVIGSLAAHTDVTDRKEAEMNLQHSLEEKELLIKEVHHRVKNNLQVISSLLSLQGSFSQDSGAKDVLKESQNRIKSMAAIHEKLYQSSNLASIDFADYTHQIISQLQYSFAISPGKVKMTTEINELDLGVDLAVPCGLLLNELLSNAFKYAFPDDRTGEVHILFDQETEGTFLMKVSDNGVGIPEDLDIENSPSLGLQLVFTLTDQLEGEVKLDRSNGTSFEIRFNKNTST